MKHLSYLRPKAVPAVMAREVYDWSKEAATQRARAIRCFLNDIHRNETPHILTEVPALSAVLETSPYFLRSLVRIDRTAPWDFDVAMDWTIRTTPDGYAPALVEGDTCAIGGLLTAALVHHLVSEWWSLDGTPYVDGTEYLHELLTRVAVEARSRDAAPLLFADGCLAQHLSSGSDGWLHSTLLRHGFRIVGPWNIRDLKYDPSHGRYVVGDSPIGAVLLHYYPCCLDRTHAGYERVPDYLKDDVQASHAVDGYWSHLDPASPRWYQTNPLGAEVLCDKGFLPYVGEMERYYLRSEPLIAETGYVSLVADDGRVARSVWEQVREEPSQWVLKSRRDSGQGVGIVRGDLLTANDGGEEEWNKQMGMVHDDPAAWVAQRVIPDLPLELPDGTVAAIEMRNIVHVFGDDIVFVDSPVARVAPPGQLRNVTTNYDAAVLPVFVPRGAAP